MRYEWETNSGGILLTELGTYDTVFLQPGDDTSAFLDDVRNTNDKWTEDDVIEQYFIG